jgi:hypothetical protein
VSRRQLLALAAIMLLAPTVEANDWHPQPIAIPTRWAAEVSPSNALPEYPRPQLVRGAWQNLNGTWRYAITGKQASAPTRWDGVILVPFPLESALSGVKKPLLPEQLLWYNRTFKRPARSSGNRVLLHFGAVDWHATVYVNGIEVGSHSGGYHNFSFDITEALRPGDNDLTLRVYDPTDLGPNPRGKQTLNPKGIMYTASSGIWQTVWLEKVPSTYVDALKLTPDVDRGLLEIGATLSDSRKDLMVEAIARTGKRVVGRASGTGTISMTIDDPHLWSPADPFLYDLEVRLIERGVVLDRVSSYFGMRKVAVRKNEHGIDRIFLNDNYTYNLGTLDQGFWPDGLYTAPTDAALKFDIQAAKAMGFNTIRKHIKIEPARWYYHCDRIGMLVWQDIVQPGGNDGAIPGGTSVESRRQFETEMKTTLTQLHNHPSVIVWTLFNEGWGTYDQAKLTATLKKLDLSRLINGHSGENFFAGLPHGTSGTWTNSDLTDIHAYPGPALPDGLPSKARVLGEHGGIGVFVEGHLWDELSVSWGYVHVDANALQARYGHIVDALKALEREGLSGSIYTQSYDVEDEQNGLMTYDRAVIKIPVAALRSMNARLLPSARTSLHVDDTISIAALDRADMDKRYTEALAEYQAGNKTPLFLRRLTVMALRREDKLHATTVGNEYVATLSRPYSAEAVEFIVAITRTSKDLGFTLMQKHPEEFNAVYGTDIAGTHIKQILEAEQLRGDDDDIRESASLK